MQALVNLKRPSIRLLPLDHGDTPEDAPATQHGLEFEYDLDAAKGRMILQVISPNKDTPPILIYDTIVEGGFAKQLKVEDGAVFELAKLEDHKSAPATVQTPVAEPSASTPGNAPPGPSKKRFSAFNFRKKSRTSGPALPVVDAQTPAAPAVPVEGQTGKVETPSEEDEGGVRVRIRIEALDEDEKPLASPNAQTTYLHIVRIGAPPEPAAEGEAPVEDTRQWMVKVVKREATIGLHTFHLHEIYGLATGSNGSNAAPSAPSHTYPPGEEEESHAQAYDFAGTECVLCLSEPREVVLLPCRHLVACKDCAMNMIEFGAGGTLTHAAEETAATPAAVPTPAANTTPGANVDLEAGNAVPPPPPPVAAPRRKRKAKGWFCPVCRQPYTSMLRITTTPPETKKLTSESNVDLVTVPNAPAPPPPAVIAGETNANTAAHEARTSLSKPPATTNTEGTANEPRSSTSAAPAADPLGATTNGGRA